MVDSYLYKLHRAQERPYHQSPEEGFPYTELSSPAEFAALGVLEDLLDRRGIKIEFRHVDYDVRQEIVETLTKIIESAYTNFDQLETKALGIRREIEN